MKIQFDKMEGAGNDFIMIDNRSGDFPDSRKVAFVQNYCRRALGIGADGVIFIEQDEEFDFAWDFYNSDGSHAEMCGNGARCASRYAHKIGAAGREMTFRTIAGPIKGQLTERGAKVQLSSAQLPEESVGIEVDGKHVSLWSLNTGVPHAVIRVDEVKDVDVEKLGRSIRRHAYFAPAGTNVDFFTIGDDGVVRIRTYERGVEGETLACGTGCVATSIVAGKFFGKASPVALKAASGEELVVYFELKGAEAINVFLEGGARLIFSGWVDDPDI
ncbi:MAG: diaminopimelate epimerase [Planctomycetota bacterium]|jgi:diaminopimelate epimerase|nr:diaminopimelate epimerase [Planctomycetota bacterium]